MGAPGPRLHEPRAQVHVSRESTRVWGENNCTHCPSLLKPGSPQSRSLRHERARGVGWAVGRGLAHPTGPTGSGRDALPGWGLFPGRWGPDRLARTPTPAVCRHVA